MYSSYRQYSIQSYRGSIWNDRSTDLRSNLELRKLYLGPAVGGIYVPLKPRTSYRIPHTLLIRVGASAVADEILRFCPERILILIEISSDFLNGGPKKENEKVFIFFKFWNPFRMNPRKAEASSLLSLDRLNWRSILSHYHCTKPTTISQARIRHSYSFGCRLSRDADFSQRKAA